MLGGAEWIRTAGPAGFLIESRVLWQFRFLRRRRSALTEKEERTGSGLLSLEKAEPAVRIHSAPPSSPEKLVPLFADWNSPSREGNGEETKDRASEHPILKAPEDLRAMGDDRLIDHLFALD